MMRKCAIFGVPRSGTSWLAQIINAHPAVIMRYQPLFSYTHKARLGRNSTVSEIEDFYNEILHTEDSFVLMQSELHKNYPKFRKITSPTHIFFKETRYLGIIENLLRQCDTIKIAGIVRNPLAVIASWMQAPREFEPDWDIREEWLLATQKNGNNPDEYYGFQKWKEVTSSFLRFDQLYPERFRLVRYDRLLKNTEDEAESLLRFFDLDCDPQVRDFIARSKSRHDDDRYSVYRGRANDQHWHNILPSEVSKSILEELSTSGLSDFCEGADHA